ncbi:unnamed protein product, partial [marine sediment metagenome]
YASGIKYVKIEYLKVNGSPSGTNNGINVQSENASNIIIQHCEVTATSNNGIFFQHTNNFTVDSCTVWNIPNSGIVVYGSQTYQASNGVIRNNTIFNVESNDGITLHRDSSGYNVGSNHFLENNVGSNCAEQAFDITAGNNITIVNCEGYGNSDSSIAVGHEASNVWIDRFYSHDEIGIRKVLGASESGIAVLLSKQFIKWVLIANIFAWPTAYFIMNKWLQSFAYRINIGVWMFVLLAVLAVGIALITVSYQAFKAARANPIDSLRYE